MNICMRMPYWFGVLHIRVGLDLQRDVNGMFYNLRDKIELKRKFSNPK